MRMQLSADDSVLDSRTDARWVKRLLITDNSALANAQQNASSSLFDGAPWVQSPPKPILASAPPRRDRLAKPWTRECRDCAR
jgi:hypothetical protein